MIKIATFGPKYPRFTEQIICNFLWNGGVSKIKYDALIGDLGDGGLNFDDIASYIENQKIMWVKRLLEDDHKQWKIIPSIYTSTICIRKTQVWQ